MDSAAVVSAVATSEAAATALLVLSCLFPKQILDGHLRLLCCLSKYKI
jgi:hypothetical protein